MSALVVVANRGPASVRVGADGTAEVQHAAGGLAPSLARALDGRGALWIAAAMSDAERDAARAGQLAGVVQGVELDYLDIEPSVLAAAYNVVANSTLWFAHHGMFDLVHRPVLDRHWHEAWAAYEAYNLAFAERVAERADHGAEVVVHDYHLALMGADLRRLRPDLRTVHFSHTPFATREELAVLPSAARSALLASMASFGALGFHCERWREQFLRALDDVAPAPVTFVAALGSDPEELHELAASIEVESARSALLERVDGRRLIVRSDRIEPSKNLIRGFLAYGELLERRPELVSRVRFVARGYASRTGLAEYLAYRAEVERTVELVNARFAHEAGGNVIELALGDDFPASLAALSLADVLLVNPIRDGMNLVAKEGAIVNVRSGALALSTEAGAFAELGPYSVAVEPFDVSGTAAALERGLELPLLERRERSVALAAAAGANPPGRWLDAVIAEARQAR